MGNLSIDIHKCSGHKRKWLVEVLDEESCEENELSECHNLATYRS